MLRPKSSSTKGRGAAESATTFAQKCEARCFSCTRSKHARWKLLSLVAVVALVLWWASNNRWAPVRSSFVAFHRVVAPVLGASDPSEGRIFAEVLPRIGSPVPRTGIPHGRGGCVWDVGANNGVWNSNSRYLIQSRGFTAFLYEPDPTSFMSLLDLYGKGSPQVHLHNMAVSDFAGTAQFRKFPTGLENTITNHNHNQFDNPDYQYVVAVSDGSIICHQLREALTQHWCDVEGNGSNGDPETFTVLSTDIEGEDLSVLRAAHRAGCHWDIVIAEIANAANPEVEKLGYRFIGHVEYNSIFVSAALNSTDGTPQLGI